MAWTKISGFLGYLWLSNIGNVSLCKYVHCFYVICVPSRKSQQNEIRRKWLTASFYKQHFYEQLQAKIGKKIKQRLWLKFRYLKIILFLHPGYHPKII